MSKTQTRNLRRWVAALESGKYNQTQDDLRDKKGYCCLGVWCALDHRARWDQRNKMYEVFGLCLEDGELGVLRDHLGITSDEEVVYIKENDAGAPFDAIAALIRRNHPEVFA